MDSLATLNVPAIGYGIRYEFGIFDQAIRDGWQVELTDKWLRFGNPWEIVRSEITFDVKLGGRTEHFATSTGSIASAGFPRRVVKGVAYDTPMPGYRGPTTNLLRLWKAEAAESFDFDAFNVGDYYGAVDQKVASETISKVLYPNDEPEAGKQLRLAQQFFFVSCSLQDMIRLHLMRGKPLDEFDSLLGGAVERHAPVHRRRRADAAARRRAPDGLGSGLGDHAADLRLHEPHAAGRSAREVAAVALRHACCRGTSRSSTRSTAASWTTCGSGFPETSSCSRRLSLIDEDGGAIRAHGASGQRGQPRDQRRRGPAQRPPQADGPARLPHRGAGQVPQRHQRRDAAALDRPEQPEAERA